MKLERSNKGLWQVKLRKIEGCNNSRIPVAEKIARDIHEWVHTGKDTICVEMRRKYYTIGETELAILLFS